MIINSRFFNRSELIGFVTLALLLFVILPLTLDVFRRNLVATYLTYAFVAIGLVLCWGYGGILSLGQGVFFGLGGYAMAMYLKLEASSAANTKIQSTPGIPDFMDWNQITQLPFAPSPRAGGPPIPSASRPPASQISWTGTKSRNCRSSGSHSIVSPL